MTYHWPYSCSYSVLLSNWTVSWPDDVTLVIHIGFCHWLGTRPSRALVTTARASWDGGSRFMGVLNLCICNACPKKETLTMHLSKADISLTPWRSFCSICAGFIIDTRKARTPNYKRVPLTSYWYQSKVMWQMLINYIRLIQWYMSLMQIRSLRHLAWGK